MISLVGTPVLMAERLVISSFGIRGIGSFYYLAYALNEASFQEIELLLAADRLLGDPGIRRPGLRRRPRHQRELRDGRARPPPKRATR